MCCFLLLGWQVVADVKVSWFESCSVAMQESGNGSGSAARERIKGDREKERERGRGGGGGGGRGRERESKMNVKNTEVKVFGPLSGLLLSHGGADNITKRSSVLFLAVNPLRSNSEQRKTSFCNVNAFSVREVMRIKDMITQREFRW